MSTDKHVPSDARMREQYIWAHAREAEGVAEQSYSIQVCSETWDAWLAAHDARVRRDAAREALAAAEHRATRAEAQAAIRGRAVVIYRERARQAEAERDRWHSMWRQRGVKHLAAEKRATRAEAERDEWRQTALDERGAALDALEQIKARDARIKAVQDALDGDA